MNVKIWIVGIIGWIAASGGALRAEDAHPLRFKSPSGRFEVLFEPAGEQTFSRYQLRPSPHASENPQYILYFVVAGSSKPISADAYGGASSSKSPADIASTFVWSPQEDAVIVTHPPDSKGAVVRWAVSLMGPTEYGFEGDHLYWIDRYRLVADLRTSKVPGGIELVNIQQHHAELVLPPDIGRGYEIVAVAGHRVTVKEFLNHWGDEQAKTSWDVFEPACFDVDLESMKKRSVPCPAANSDTAK